MKKLFSIILICALILCGTQAFAGVMVISSTPTYDDSEAMAKNLDRAIELLNNKVIIKGQPFSFNETVGARTYGNGFVIAPNGNGVPVIGGGVSQIATKLHIALKELGGDISYDVMIRNPRSGSGSAGGTSQPHADNHDEMNVFGNSYTANYVEQATDAILTDYSRGLDYRFTSNHAENLAITMWRAGTTVFCQLTGIGSATAAPNTVFEPEATVEPKPTNQPQSSYETMRVTNVNSHVNLRKEPSTSAESLIQIPKDATVQFTGETSGVFMKVIYEGIIGYAHGDYLSRENTKPITMTVVNCKQNVTLRKSPSTDAKKLASIPLGETVEYLGVTDSGFHKVKYDGMTGYVSTAYLTDTEQ